MQKRQSYIRDRGLNDSIATYGDELVPSHDNLTILLPEA